MTDQSPEATSVLDRVEEAFACVAMPIPVGHIVAAGRARRRRRNLATAAGVAAVTGCTIGVATYGHGTTAPTTANPAATTPVHVRTLAYTVDTKTDGTVQVSWTKQHYIDDPQGLEAALRQAGFPVLIKVGEFCQGPDDDGYLNRAGQGIGVDQVMRPVDDSDGNVAFTFVPAAMPAGMELFIGYLSPAQLAITHGGPGSVERLVPTGTTLTCTTQAPPANPEPSPAGTANG
jgi:hypothetical protein